MNSLIPIAAASLIIGGGIGYLFGNQDAGVPAPVVPDSQPSSTSLSNRTRVPASAQAVVESTEKPRSYEEVAAMSGQTNRLQGLIDLYANLSNEEFAAEADKLNSLPFNERILAAYVLFGSWAETAPFDALEHASSMGQAGMFVRPTILQGWASSDPKGAAEYYTANKSEFAMMGMFGGRGGMGGSGAATIAGEWAKQDPEGALAWAKSLDGRDSSDAVSKALSEIATTDPLKASQMTAGLEGSALAEANSSIASEWARKDWSATEAWVNGLPADQRGDALGAAVRSLADQDPALAGVKALSIPEGDARNQAVESVAQAMSRENPGDAVAWVMKNGNESSQQGAMREVMSTWAAQDPVEARAWVEDQPEGPVRDSAASTYVLSDNSGSGADQVALAESISDERSRGWTIGVATMRWMEQDKDAATSYIQSTEAISEDAKNRILERAEGGGGRPGGR